MTAAKFRCPICRRPVERDTPDFPFCSERCRRIDLGHWATGDYRIAGEPVTQYPHDDHDE